ncbi:iron donor protein CyaY [Porticoccaceae bacterium]|jgi:CyaY protein|nr:iron donor protein CyaY [Porticoccaceae bacterium]
MNEAEFNQIVDELMFSIEESIDHSGADLDYENSAGMLTITCEANGSQIILSRQPAMGEIWLAARSGGFHFRLQAEDGAEDLAWRNTVTAEPLSTMLAEACTVQSGEQVSFDF